MSRTVRDKPAGATRNTAARVALLSSLVFLVQPVSVMIYYLLLYVGFKPLDVANPTHPLAGLIAVSSVLCLRIDFFVGLPALILGGVGLRAAGRLPGRPGRREAVAAIVLGLLVPLLSAGNYLFMAADWRQ